MTDIFTLNRFYKRLDLNIAFTSFTFLPSISLVTPLLGGAGGGYEIFLVCPPLTPPRRGILDFILNTLMIIAMRKRIRLTDIFNLNRFFKRLDLKYRLHHFYIFNWHCSGYSPPGRGWGWVFIQFKISFSTQLIFVFTSKSSKRIK